MATEEILTGAQLVPNANIVINPIGVTNRIGDGLKNAVTQINGLADRMTLAEEGLSSQSRQIAKLGATFWQVVVEDNMFVMYWYGVEAESPISVALEGSNYVAYIES